MIDRRRMRKKGSGLFGLAAGLLVLFWLLSLPLAAQTGRDRTEQPAASNAGSEPRKELRDAPGETHEVLFRANQAYLEGRYGEAASGYESLLETGQINGHILYNLGNSYIRMGELGKAILKYREASLFLPRDGDLKANLQYARSLRQDRIEAETNPTLLHTLAFWYYGTSLRELFLAFLALHALFWCSALLRLFRRSEWILWFFGLSLLLSLATGVSAALKYREIFYGRAGVILAGEVPVRAGFTQQDTVLYVLHEGTDFSILGEEKGYWKISLPDGKKGWIPVNSAGRVAPGSNEPGNRAHSQTVLD